MSSQDSRTRYSRAGETAFEKSDKVSQELFVLTYGAVVQQLVSDFEDEGSHLQLYPTIQCDGWSGNTNTSVLLGYNIPVTNECSRWQIGTLSGTDTISIGSFENAFAHSGTPDINLSNAIVADPFNPGRIYSGHSYTGNSDASILVRHQLASFEL